MITSPMPDFEGQKTLEGRIDEAIRGYYQLRRELEHGLSNIEPQNFTSSFFKDFTELTGGYGRLTTTVQELGVSLADAEGDIAAVTLTAQSLQTKVTSHDGQFTEISQWSDFVESKVGSSDGSVEGSINSTITQHAELISLKVNSKDYTGDNIISKINLSSGAVLIEANKVNITGFVTFSALETEGQTIINGANIKTGEIEGIVVRSGNLVSQGSCIEMTANAITSMAAVYNGTYGYYESWMHGVRIVCGDDTAALELWDMGSFLFELKYASDYDELTGNDVDKVFLASMAPMKIVATGNMSIQAGGWIWVDSNIRLNRGVGIYDVNGSILLGGT